MLRRIITLWVAVCCGACLFSCALRAQVGGSPAYDLESVYLNDDLGAVRSYVGVNRAKTRNAILRQLGWGEARAVAVRINSRSRRTPLGGAANDRTHHVSPSRTTAARRSKKGISTASLGDGSVAGELVAAAERLVGMEEAFSPETLLAHLMSVAAIKLRSDGPEPFITRIWLALARRGATFEARKRAALAGDLAFFHHVSDVSGDGRTDSMSGVAVVEEVMADGVMVCIGHVRGSVRRFVLDPKRPWKQYDGKGMVINSMIRPDDSSDTRDLPDLAGVLLAGFARP